MYARVVDDGCPSRNASTAPENAARPKLLGLAANLNIVQSELDLAGREFREASKQINTAVVEIHRVARWSSAELARMGRVQNWIIEQLITTRPAGA